VARALMDRGFSKVRPLEGGLEAWIAAGLPVEEHEEAPLYPGTGPLPTVP
jgi:3-mercaptopyruvate sulfurtransferase SseA